MHTNNLKSNLILIFYLFFLILILFFEINILKANKFEEFKDNNINVQCKEALVFYNDRPDLYAEYYKLLEYCKSTAVDLSPSGFASSPIISDFRSMYGVNSRNRMNIHQGIDIISGPEQPIIAITDGKVLETTIEKCWGPTLVVDHGKSVDGKRLIVIYGHIGEFLVKENEYVKRGDIVAKMPKKVKFRCMARVRHLHLQIGQEYCEKEEKNKWGCKYFIRDFYNSLNPHLFWANGKNNITCYEKNKIYNAATITYPFICKKIK